MLFLIGWRESTPERFVVLSTFEHSLLLNVYVNTHFRGKKIYAAVTYMHFGSIST